MLTYISSSLAYNAKHGVSSVRVKSCVSLRDVDDNFYLKLNWHIHSEVYMLYPLVPFL